MKFKVNVEKDFKLSQKTKDETLSVMIHLPIIGFPFLLLFFYVIMPVLKVFILMDSNVVEVFTEEAQSRGFTKDYILLSVFGLAGLSLTGLYFGMMYIFYMAGKVADYICKGFGLPLSAEIGSKTKEKKDE